MSRASWLGNIAQWWSALASTLALILSVFTGYYVAFRHVEELRVSVDEFGKFEFDKSINAFRIGKSLGLLFVNAGSTPAAIRAIMLVLDERDGKSWRGCPGIRDVRRDSSFAVVGGGITTLVLKEKEIMHHRLTLRPPVKLVPQFQTVVETENELQVSPGKGFDPNHFNARLCVIVVGATPSENVDGSFLVAIEYKDPTISGVSSSTALPPMHLVWRRSMTPLTLVSQLWHEIFGQ